MKKHFTYLVLLTFAVVGTLSAQSTDTTKTLLLDSLKREYSYEAIRSYLNFIDQRKNWDNSFISWENPIPIAQAYPGYFERRPGKNVIHGNGFFYYKYGSPATARPKRSPAYEALTQSRRVVDSMTKVVADILMADPAYSDAINLLDDPTADKKQIRDILNNEFNRIRAANVEMGYLKHIPGGPRNSLNVRYYKSSGEAFSPDITRDNIFILISDYARAEFLRDRNENLALSPQKSVEVSFMALYYSALKSANYAALRIILDDHINQKKDINIDWFPDGTMEKINNNKLRDIQKQIKALDKQRPG